MRVELAYVNGLLGLDLAEKDVQRLLGRMRYGVSANKEALDIQIPSYRTDVLHPIDVVEDVAIAYGYENFEPELPPLPTVGSRIARERVADDLRTCLVGFGFQEVMTLTMTNAVEQFDKMGVPREKAAEAEKPVSEEHAIARTWLLPSLMGALEKNRNREYPQRLFEVGVCVTPAGETVHRLAGVVAQAKTDFAEVKALVAGILESRGMKADANACGHGSFIPGRAAENSYGFFGEVAPAVIANFGLGVPVTAFELDVAALADN